MGGTAGGKDKPRRKKQPSLFDFYGGGAAPQEEPKGDSEALFPERDMQAMAEFFQADTNNKAKAPSGSNDRRKILDFGDVDGGRKSRDKFKDDIEKIDSARQGKKLIWPRPSLHGYRARGYDPKVAAFIVKAIYASIPSIPPVLKNADSMEMKVLELGEEKFSGILDDYRDVVEKVKNIAEKIPPDADLRSARKLAEESFVEEFLVLSGPRSYRWKPQYKDMSGKIFDKNLFGVFLQNAKSSLYTRVYSWEDLIKKKPKPSEPEAKKGEQKESTRRAIQNLEYLSHVRIIGPDWEVPPIDGKIGEWIMKEYGIRGGEFGNWMSQKDRVATLKLFVHSAAMMCEALRMPRDILGLRGELAVAWGSRGKPKTAGHYEPSNQIFNLTKYHGAGVFAHEYYHALHHFILRHGIPDERSRVVMSSSSLNEEETSGVGVLIMTRIDEMVEKLHEEIEQFKLDEKKFPGESPKLPHLPEEEALRVAQGGLALFKLSRLQLGIKFPEASKRIDGLIREIQMEKSKEGYPKTRVSLQGVLLKAISGGGTIYYTLPLEIRKAILPLGRVTMETQVDINTAETEGKEAIRSYLKLREELSGREPKNLEEAKEIWNKKRDLVSKMLQTGRDFSRYASFYGGILAVEKTVRESLQKSRRRKSGNCKYYGIQKKLHENLTGEKSALYERSLKLDESEALGRRKKGKKYFSTSQEMMARGFERYMLDKTAEMGWRNDYLVGPSKGAAEQYIALGMEYPYPTKTEMEEGGLAGLYDDMIDNLRESGILSERSIGMEIDSGVRIQAEYPPVVEVEIDVGKERRLSKEATLTEKAQIRQGQENGASCEVSPLK